MAAGFALVNAKPNRPMSLVLSWLLFAAGIGVYLYIAEQRHHENAEDRVTPTIAQMVSGMTDAVMKPAEEDEAAPDGASLWQRVSSSMLWKETKRKESFQHRPRSFEKTQRLRGRLEI